MSRHRQEQDQEPEDEEVEAALESIGPRGRAEQRVFNPDGTPKNNHSCDSHRDTEILWHKKSCCTWHGKCGCVCHQWEGEKMTDKEAARLGIDSRTYDPRGDFVEEIMKLVDKHVYIDCGAVDTKSFRQDLFTLLATYKI